MSNILSITMTSLSDMFALFFHTVNSAPLTAPLKLCVYSICVRALRYQQEDKGCTNREFGLKFPLVAWKSWMKGQGWVWLNLSYISLLIVLSCSSGAPLRLRVDLEKVCLGPKHNNNRGFPVDKKRVCGLDYCTNAILHALFYAFYQKFE